IFEAREIRRREVRRTAEHLREPRREQIEHELRGLARRDRAGDARKLLRGLSHASGMIYGQLAAHASLEFGRKLGEAFAIARHARVPVGMRGSAARTGIPRGWPYPPFVIPDDLRRL